MSTAPSPSKLDSGQILPAAFDESTGRLRVDTEITAIIDGAQEVIISHEDDSIKIGDGIDLLKIDGNGSAQVTLKDAAGASYDSTNPIPVVQVSTTSGTPLFKYKVVDTPGITASSFDDHEYVVAGSALKITSVYATASGLIKIEVMRKNGAAYTPYFAGFNSSNTPNIRIDIDETFAVPVGESIIIRVYNRELVDQSAYTTIVGEHLT